MWKSAVVLQHNLCQAGHDFFVSTVVAVLVLVINHCLEQFCRMTANHTSSAFRQTAIGPWARNAISVNEVAYRVVRMRTPNAMIEYPTKIWTCWARSLMSPLGWFCQKGTAAPNHFVTLLPTPEDKSGWTLYSSFPSSLQFSFIDSGGCSAAHLVLLCHYS